MKESVGYGARLYFFDYCKEGEDIIFPAINTNWLCSMNENGVVRIMAAIPKQEGIKIALYPGIFKSDDIIYLFPYNGNKKQILLYNLKLNEFGNIEIPNNDQGLNSVYSANVYECDECIYFVTLASEIYRIDKGDYAISCVFEPKDIEYTVVYTYQNNNSIFIAMQNTNKIMEYNIDSNKTILHELEKRIKIEVFSRDEGHYYITMDNHLIIIDEKTNEIIKDICIDVKMKPDDKFSEVRAKEVFDRILQVDDKCILFSTYEETIYVYDKNKKTIHSISIDDEKETEESICRKGRYSIRKYTCASYYDNHVYFQSFKRKCVYDLDVETWHYTSYYPVIDERDINKQILDQDWNNVVYESDMYYPFKSLFAAVGLKKNY